MDLIIVQLNLFVSEALHLLSLLTQLSQGAFTPKGNILTLRGDKTPLHYDGRLRWEGNTNLGGYFDPSI